MKSSLFLLIILTINLASCLNKPDHSPLHEYELVIDSIIEGYDSKDIEVYKNAQYRIAESFILYDIIEDSLLSSKDKDYLATKLDQAESTWYKHDNNTFFKTTFITSWIGASFATIPTYENTRVFAEPMNNMLFFIIT